MFMFCYDLNPQEPASCGLEHLKHFAFIIRDCVCLSQCYITLTRHHDQSNFNKANTALKPEQELQRPWSMNGSHGIKPMGSF
ncbi:rCG54998 [Rattus norvegicus]|uniref:RCG54998 n=1 Tax=Rattus norvegicus TaxID=10116 RepID=A6III6_RAT|nr:rCG54998 [Rattus norvegicus]